MRILYGFLQTRSLNRAVLVSSEGARVLLATSCLSDGLQCPVSIQCTGMYARGR
jgi:hypothetical protein